MFQTLRRDGIISISILRSMVLCGCLCLFLIPSSLPAQEKTKVPALLKLLFPLKAVRQKPAEEKQVQQAEAAAEADFEIVNAANVDPFQQQFTRQFRGLLKAELFFLNHTCHADLEQRGKMKIAGNLILKNVVLKFVEIQKKMNQGGFDWNSPTPEPRKFLQEGLVDEAKRILYPEQVALYETELIRRREVRKLACITNVVARMDDELILTAEQRAKLTEELSAKWHAAETQQLEIFLYGEHYFPNVPEQFVTSVLNAKQKDVWRGMTRNGTINFGIGHIGNVTIDENAWNDESVGEGIESDKDAREPATKVEEKQADTDQKARAREEAAKAAELKEEAAIKAEKEKK